jgi:hypothetical protein
MTTEKYPIPWPESITYLSAWGIRMHPAYREFFFASFGKAFGRSLDPSIPTDKVVVIH